MRMGRAFHGRICGQKIPLKWFVVGRIDELQETEIDQKFKARNPYSWRDPRIKRLKQVAGGELEEIQPRDGSS